MVGEILVKYHPAANNNIVDVIEQEGGEAVVPDLLDFFLYGMYSKEFNYMHLSGTYNQMQINKIGIRLIEYFRKPARKALRESRRFEEPMRARICTHQYVVLRTAIWDFFRIFRKRAGDNARAIPILWR